MDEIVLINKPEGWTSFDVVAKVRSLLRKEYLDKGIKPTKKQLKVGHAGTLDPLATGLLIILIGDKTKRQSEFMKQDKTYKVILKLGETSTTGDEEGEKKPASNIQPSPEQVKIALNSFVGKQTQIPPSYSALKIKGQRAYLLARKGKYVELPPRNIIIYSITNVIYRYPNIIFTTRVSSGTYIRSLVADIGIKLTTGAYMTDLKRLSIGRFNLKDAVNINQLTVDNHLIK